MGNHKNYDLQNPTKSKLIIVLWALLPLFILPGFWRLYIRPTSDITMIMISGLGMYLAYIDLIIIYARSEKFYNWPVFLFILLTLTLFLYRYHISTPGNTAFLICIISIGTSLKFLKRFKNNSFLRWFGFSTSIITAVFMFGFAATSIPSGIGNFIGYIGSFLFLLVVIGMVFILPASEYFKWSENERKAFFRGIIIPMCFVFCLICLIFVFNDTYRILRNSDFNSIPWNVTDIKLFDLEGIPKL